jgi:hypothetical protein
MKHTHVLTLRFAIVPLIAVLLSGCVTHINTGVSQNPPPLEKFSAFTHFELDQVSLAPPYAGQDANERARDKIQENVLQKADPLLGQWHSVNVEGRGVRTLVFTPEIHEIKFISGGARVWAGALAGSSAVILKVTISEKETGKVIATPMFYARAAAMGGAWTFGATDNVMLVRIAGRFTDYMAANYDSAVGGPTGAEPSG